MEIVNLNNCNLHMGGIYKIEDIINHKIYIGKATNFNQRFTQHLYQLRMNIDSDKLQKAYNFNQKCFDNDGFKFCPLENYEGYSLSIREQYYINKFDSINNGYNEINAFSSK